MRVSDLKPDHDLMIYCQNPRKCGHSVSLNRFEAAGMFGGETTLASLRERCRCSVCGCRDIMTVVQYVGRTGG
jgi:hypothetical protein